MTLGKRIYWVVALVAVMVLAGAAVTVTSRLTSAGGPDPASVAQTCDAQDEADDAAEAANPGPDADNIEEECGLQDGGEADDAGTDTVVPCSNPTGADDDAAEAKGAPDTDNVEEQCGPQDAEA